MSTRRQNPEQWQFKQDAFASSSEFERGVLGNLVAARCKKVNCREEVAVLWWLQQVSWRPGGLDKFAADFLAEHSSLIGTPSMHKYGMRPGQIYSSEQVRVVRAELCPSGQFRFPLQGERGFNRVMSDDELAVSIEAERQANLPTGYRAERFRELCEMDAAAFADVLKRMLVDPEVNPAAGLWNMPGLWSALCQIREQEVNSAGKRIVETEVTRRVFEELDYALEARTFVLVEGREGIGKTEAARVWCDQRPGKALYIRIEAGVDETTLYRSIAQQLGTACSYQRKAVEMRARIQDALQSGQLMLVLDEAHFLWPQSGRCERAAPKRVDWLRTTIIDFGVPVALISTPQYFARACERFRKGGWNSLQIQRRLARTATLPEPDAVPLRDVLAVVRGYFPEVGEITAKRIAALAIGTVGFLTSIRHLRDRVEFLARRRPNFQRLEVITEALHEAGLPSADAKTTEKTAENVPVPAPSRRQMPGVSSVVSARSAQIKIHEVAEMA